MCVFIMVVINCFFDFDEVVLWWLLRKILVDLFFGLEREKILGVMLKEEVFVEDVDLV